MWRGGKPGQGTARPSRRNLLLGRPHVLNAARGIYGWDQTVENSNPRRLAHSTPIRNLYLSGAWTAPGGGYGGVLASALGCSGEIMAKWG